MATFYVLRQHFGDRSYVKGDTREANESDVAHLVRSGVLKLVEPETPPPLPTPEPERPPELDPGQTPVPEPKAEPEPLNKAEEPAPRNKKARP